MTQKLQDLKADIQKLKNPDKAQLLQRFFKTGKGDYGEGDIFLGIMVPQSRKIAQKYCELSLSDIDILLKSKFHEERLIALLILVDRFKKGDKTVQLKIFDFYLKSTKYINNWDLVDLTAPQIGQYLLEKDRPILKRLATSKNLWEKRIAIMFTAAFIRQNRFGETLEISEILLADPHDLIHKAVGWMLREIGKKDQKTEEAFLKKHYHKMPRTMLRYAIERFPEKQRQKYLLGKI